MNLKNAIVSVLAVCMSAGLCVPVFAQPGGGGGGGGERGGRGGGGGMGMMFGGGRTEGMSASELERVATMLKMTDDQKEAAKTLLEGAMAPVNAKRAEMEREMEAAREEFRETRDPSVWMALGEKRQEVQTLRDKQIKAFMTDLQVILTPEQQQAWPRVERMQRREQTLGSNPLAINGERVDLTQLVERMQLNEESKAKVDPLLERYETEMDPLLVRRAEQMEKATAQREAIMRAFSGQGGDTAEIEKIMKEGLETSQRLRDLNKRYAKELAGAMDTETAARFEQEFKRSAYPMVYRRQGLASRQITAAEGMELEASQKQALVALKETYTREIAAVNERAERALEERDNAMTFQNMMGGGAGGGGGGGGRGGPMGFMMGMNDPAMEEIRTQRQAVEDRTTKAIEGLLTEEQRAKLPQGREGAGGGEGERRQRGNRGGGTPPMNN